MASMVLVVVSGPPVVQVSFEPEPPTSTSQLLELQTRATTPSSFHTLDVGQK